MAAYSISEVRVRDPELMQRYRQLATPAIERYGGRYLARGVPGAAEGEWPADTRMIIIEFPSMERLREWYDSPEYAEARAVRADALDRRLLFIDGG